MHKICNRATNNTFIKWTIFDTKCAWKEFILHHGAYVRISEPTHGKHTGKYQTWDHGTDWAHHYTHGQDPREDTIQPHTLQWHQRSTNGAAPNAKHGDVSEFRTINPWPIASTPYNPGTYLPRILRSYGPHIFFSTYIATHA